MYSRLIVRGYCDDARSAFIKGKYATAAKLYSSGINLILDLPPPISDKRARNRKRYITAMLFERSEVLCRLGRFREALDDCERVIEAEDGSLSVESSIRSARMYSLKGRLYLRMEWSPSEAGKAYSTAVRICLRIVDETANWSVPLEDHDGVAIDSDPGSGALC